MVTNGRRTSQFVSNRVFRWIFLVCFSFYSILLPVNAASPGIPGGEINPNDFRISHMGVDGSIDESGGQPASAYNPNNNEFLVVWHGHEDIPPVDDAEFEIWGQLVDALTGNLIGKRFRISYMGLDGSSNYYASDADVVYNHTRQEFLVVWSGKGSDLDDREIFVQRFVYDTNGELVKKGANTLISQTFFSTDYHFEPAVAYNDNDDEYLVVWQVYTDFSTGTNENEIIGQRLGHENNNLVEVGSDDFRISHMGPDGDSDYYGSEADVGYNNLYSEYLVVWAGTDNNGGLKKYEYEIWGNPISGDGTLGTAKRLSGCGPAGNTDYDCRKPAVAYNQQLNQWLVVWEGLDQIGNPARDIYEVFGQQLVYSSGKLEEYGLDDFRISSMGQEDNAPTSNMTPAVAADSNFYLVAWSGNDNRPPLAKEELEIFGQFINAGSGKEIGLDDFRISDMGPDGNKKFEADWPAVSYASGQDHFLVTWGGDDNTPPLVDDEVEIFGQLYDPYAQIFIPLVINK